MPHKPIKKPVNILAQLGFRFGGLFTGCGLVLLDWKLILAGFISIISAFAIEIDED